MRVAAALAGLALAAGPAQALSCLRPDPLALYREARDSADLYRIVVGRFVTERPIALPAPARPPDDPPPARTKARLVGLALGPDGFATPHDAPVTLELGCLSVWCATAPETGTDLLVSIRVTDEGAVVGLGPCPWNALPVTPEDLAAVADCHTGGPCGD